MTRKEIYEFPSSKYDEAEEVAKLLQTCSDVFERARRNVTFYDQKRTTRIPSSEYDEAEEEVENCSRHAVTVRKDALLIIHRDLLPFFLGKENIKTRVSLGKL
ncbi:hypothetical protein CEXT_566411 [Caerostris extrusa]|uniref:Uncharacterized protein n=1 Tax=Caerostris extrusa TaxID=172846 RepID=A0AAV4UMZ0_CAEEX|nr:hypothetical protein CEXT_566411 [Caerostris extrusa]